MKHDLRDPGAPAGRREAAVGQPADVGRATRPQARRGGGGAPGGRGDARGRAGHDEDTDKETADLRMLPVKKKRTAVLLLRLTNGAATAKTVR